MCDDTGLNFCSIEFNLVHPDLSELVEEATPCSHYPEGGPKQLCSVSGSKAGALSTATFNIKKSVGAIWLVTARPSP